MICQLSCQMMAQVHMSVQISLVNFHIHHLSCNMQLRCILELRWQPGQLCLADQDLGCNQSGLAAMCEYYGSAQNRLSAGMQPAKSQLSCLYYQGCTWSASLYYVSAWCNLSAVQMRCQLSCNALAQIVSIKWQLLAAISHSRCQQSMSRYYIADFWQSSTASKWKGVCCVSSSRPNKSWHCNSSSFSEAFAIAQGGHLLVEPLLLLKGVMEGLYSAAVAQEDIMQGAEEEGLPRSNGF